MLSIIKFVTSPEYLGPFSSACLEIAKELINNEAFIHKVQKSSSNHINKVNMIPFPTSPQANQSSHSGDHHSIARYNQEEYNTVRNLSLIHI